MAFDYSGSGILALSIVMIVVSIISIVLRFWSRTVVLNKDYGLDDWLALVATIFTVGQLACGPVFAANGIGNDILTLDWNQLEAILKTFYAASLINCVALTFIKFSQLAFYVRIFGFRSNPSTFWKVTFCITTFFAVAYPLWSIPVLARQCDPVEKNWNPFLPGYCLSLLDVIIAYTAFNIFTDLLILLQPLPPLLRLRMKNSRKAVLTIAFVIGYSAPIIAIGRMITIIVLSNSLNTDITRALVPVGYWLQAEPGISLLAISTPPIYQLLGRLFHFGPMSVFNTRSYDDSFNSESEASNRPIRKSRLHWKNHAVPESRGSDASTANAMSDQSPDVIRVKQQYAVTYAV